MRVLITGALGFIGSHLAEAYIGRGDTVYGIDDLSGNVVDEIPGVDCVHDDVRGLADHPFDVDLVVHAASPVGAVALLDRPSIVAEIIESTQAVLHFCASTDTPLVNISSSEVYGFSGVYGEHDACVIPHRLTHRIQYAAGKLAAEHLVRTSSVPALSIRPFNIAGPRQASVKGFVIPTFCEQALAGEPLTVFDDGLQERCPTAVWDIVDFIVNCDPTKTPGMVVNVGNDANWTTVIALAQMVLEVTGSQSPVTFTTGKDVHGPDYEEAVGRMKIPDISLAKALGWKARTGLREMIERTASDVVPA